MKPNFLLIGAQKAGTTWWAHCLAAHPEIFIAREKELHYFNHCYDKGLDWYEANFRPNVGERAVGEATPGYLPHPAAPGRIRETLGTSLHFLATLRHPVDRAFSSFWNQMRIGRLPASTEFPAFFAGAAARSVRERGFYGRQLQRYFDNFPRERFLVHVYEETHSRRSEAIKESYEFLGVNTEFEPLDLHTRVNRSADIRLLEPQIRFFGRLFKKVARRLHPPVRDRLLQPIRGKGLAASDIKREMSWLKRSAHRLRNSLPVRVPRQHLTEDVRQELMQHYAADVSLLEEILGRDLEIWKSP